MSHTRLFQKLQRALRIARLCHDQDLPAAEGLARAAERTAAAARARPPSRRDLLRGAGGLLGAAACDGWLAARPAHAAKISQASIAIVGGGLAGLVCADRLRRAGVYATIYEGHPGRLGGRCWSNRTTFPGQVDENGGEMIDNLGKVMLGYAQEFKLEREDYNKNPGATFFHVGGALYSEADIVEELRQFTRLAQADLRTLSRAPSALSHTPADVALDQISLAEYLSTRGRDLPLAQAVLNAAYVSEYGLEAHEQSCLNLLLFLHMDRRAKFNPYGASDERWHIVGGNDQIVGKIRERLVGPVNLGTFLRRLSRNLSGKYELTFDGATQPEYADAVVLALPFSTLRRVELDASLGLGPQKLNAIAQLGYGVNVKTSIGFDGRPWSEAGCRGDIYADLPNLSNTWETNWTRAGATSVLTDYAGGDRARGLQAPPQSCGGCHSGRPAGAGNAFDSPVGQSQVDAFLGDLDQVIRGAKARATRTAAGQYRFHRAHWQAQRTSQGSYTCYRPGQFTSIAGIEGQPAGRLKFAGEHTDSFYEWQGFLEGAARSGNAAADALLDDMKAGLL